MSKEDDFAEGAWVSHGVTGDRYRVAGDPDRPGKLCFVRDLPGSPIRLGWTHRKLFRLDEVATRMLDAQKAQIAHAAVRCFLLQSPTKRRAPEWASLSTEQRANWITGKPDLTGTAMRIYNAVLVALEDL